MTTTKPTVTTPGTLEAMSARIAELEATNKRLLDSPTPPASTAGVHVPQGQDVTRKNGTETITQITRSGNVRTTVDPSLEFVAEQAGSYGDVAVAEQAETHDTQEDEDTKS